MFYSALPPKPIQPTRITFVSVEHTRPMHVADLIVTGSSEPMRLLVGVRAGEIAIISRDGIKASALVWTRPARGGALEALVIKIQESK